MKKTILRIFAVSALLITNLACSQKTESSTMKSTQTKKSSAVEADSIAILEAKKKLRALPFFRTGPGVFLCLLTLSLYQECASSSMASSTVTVW